MSRAKRAVVGGVDCHADHHHAVALNQRGQLLGDTRFSANRAGYRQLLEWLAAQGELQAVGVESTGSYGAGLTRFLVSSGVRVLAGDLAVIPKDTSGVVEAIRQLNVARRGAVKARSQALVQLRDLVTAAPAELRETLCGTTLRRQASRCRRLRPDPQRLDHPAEAAKLALRSLAQRIAALDREVAALGEALAPLIRSIAARTTALLGAGDLTASQLLITAGQNIDRLRNECVFAHLCGVDPIPASSGKTMRHRLNRGGDRAANAALHTIAIVRLRYCSRTRAYAARRTEEGLSKKEIIRCLKRYIAREVYRALRADLLAQPAA